MTTLGAAAKRTIDIIGALTGLVLGSPLFLLVGIIIKSSSPGPVFFRQERIGRFGRPFRILKFRSMRPDAEQWLRRDPQLWEAYVANGFKLPDGGDPRVTPIGKFLRKTSLDELPQLWNVLVGEMSLVGPRPLIKEEIDEWYEGTSPELLSVRPGVTGLWQVSGRSEIGYPERANLELSYVRTHSFWGDIAIVWRTVQVVASKKGAH